MKRIYRGNLRIRLKRELGMKPIYRGILRVRLTGARDQDVICTILPDETDLSGSYLLASARNVGMKRIYGGILRMCLNDMSG